MTGDTATRFRVAGPEDTAAVAALHAASWRRHYRGILSDAYLDGPIENERLQVWTERLAHPRAGLVTILAEDGQELCGFVCALLDHDREFGSLIDNLHVAAARQGRGLGRGLMRAAGEAMAHALPRRPVYLFVFDSNKAAQGFYDRIGGVVAERGRETQPDGSAHLVLRYIWPSPAALIAGTP